MSHALQFNDLGGTWKFIRHEQNSKLGEQRSSPFQRLFPQSRNCPFFVSEEDSTKRTCPICSKRIHQRSLKRHISLQHTDYSAKVQRVSCFLCGRSYKHADSLYGHLRISHGLYAQDVRQGFSGNGRTAAEEKDLKRFSGNGQTATDLTSPKQSRRVSVSLLRRKNGKKAGRAVVSRKYRKPAMQINTTMSQGLNNNESGRPDNDGLSSGQVTPKKNSQMTTDQTDTLPSSHSKGSIPVVM